MLELQIIDGLRPELVVARTKTFGVQGGVIGRDPACDWVLLDRQKIISGRHARVSYSQGQFYLTDVSTNGVQDAAGRAFPKNELQALKLGDVFVIGPYRIHVAALQHPHADLKLNDDLQRLLVDESCHQALVPFDYAAQAQRLPDELTRFDLKEQSFGTLKAYEFVPQGLDLVLNVKRQEEREPQVQESGPVVGQEQQLPAVIAEDHGVSPDVLVQLFEAFGLDQRLFSGMSADALQNKLVGLVTELLRMSLDVRALLQVFAKNFGCLNSAESLQHNPFKLAVSGRQLFELLMREDAEFMGMEAALVEIKTELLSLKKFLEVLPQVAQQLLAQLDPQLFIKPGERKFNFLQERQAWQVYQQHYQNFAAMDARAWLAQLQQLVKEKL